MQKYIIKQHHPNFGMKGYGHISAYIFFDERLFTPGEGCKSLAGNSLRLDN
jgi:hypothetical protein